MNELLPAFVVHTHPQFDGIRVEHIPDQDVPMYSITIGRVVMNVTAHRDEPYRSIAAHFETAVSRGKPQAKRVRNGAVR